MSSPAERLVGLKLPGGWNVVRSTKAGYGATGGNFSCSYDVAHEDGSLGFLKALDYSVAFRAKDPPSALQALTSAFVFERNILGQCRTRKMDHVVQAIGDGNVTVDDGPLGKVDYLIFERADGDLRGFLSSVENVETAWKLRSLHHMATGLSQLHSAEIAHQDVKPSNVLIFGALESKLADLGCASQRGTVSPRDDMNWAGDPAYAPPEQIYGHLDPEWSNRRLGCDAYHLGSMIVFMFTGLNATSLLFSKMHPSHLPGIWTGTYTEVLPYARESFGLALKTFRDNVSGTEELRDELKILVGYLCEPDLALRGHPRNRTGFTTRLSLERFVSRLDLLARRAEMQMKGSR